MVACFECYWRGGVAQAPAGEQGIASYPHAQLVNPINACLRYEALRPEVPAIELAAWLQQSHHTKEARQVWPALSILHLACFAHACRPACCYAGLARPCFVLQAASSKPSTSLNPKP